MILGPANTYRTQNLEQKMDITDQGLYKTKDFGIQQESMLQFLMEPEPQSRWPIPKFLNEFWKLFKFALVGAAAFLIHFCLYYFFTRFLMPDIYPAASYILAMAYSMTFNYSAHRAWTFSDHKLSSGSVYRYVIVVGSAALINTFIFYMGHHLLQLYDLYVVLFASAVVPFITYAGHRWFTFKTLTSSF